MMRKKLYPKYLQASDWKARDYQAKILSEIEQNTLKGFNRILVSSAPGSGKTGIMAELARSSYLAGKKTTILLSQSCLITNSKNKKNLDQTLGALVKAKLGHLTGVIAGGFPGFRNDDAPIQVVMLQSLNERNHEVLIDTDQILIDEAHSNSFYTQAEIAYRSWNWKRIINFTATPYNRSMGADENFGSLVRNTAIVCGPTYRQLEKMGYLSPLRYHVNSNLVDGKLDLDSDEAIYQNLLKFKSTCQKLNLPHNFAVAFCKPKNKNGKAQYQTIERIARELNLPPFIHVGDGIDLETQSEAQRLFNLGEINLSCIHSLSTGWDNPKCRHVMFMRSVGSRDRAVQIATRTDRIHNSKKFGEIWDFSQTFQILGEESGLHPKVEDLSDSIDESVLQPKIKKEGEAPLKSCANKSCKHKMHPSVMICEKCGTKQPSSSIPMVLATGDIVSFASEEIIKSDLKYSTAFFRQWRKIAYLNKWTPFSAHKKLADLGVSVGLDDSRYWLNSLEISRSEYRKYLEEYSKAWNWDSSKIDRELIREFGA